MNHQLLSRPSEDAIQHLPDVFPTQFNKDYMLERIQSIMKDEQSHLSRENVQEAWADFLELVVEPVGWDAVWIPSQEAAEEYGCVSGRNGACIVQVMDVGCADLMAQVEIDQHPSSWSQDFPRIIQVKVVELFPLASQENSTISLAPTAEALELLRIFYKHLWRPWDENNPIQNWNTTCLVNRVNLYFDLVNKSGSYGVAQKLERLAQEAVKAGEEIALLEENADLESSDDSLDENLIGRLGELNIRREDIAKEAMVMEDPFLRQVLATSRLNRLKKKRKDLNPGITLVWQEGSMKDFSELVEFATREHYSSGVNTSNSDVCTRVVESVEHALSMAVTGDTIVVAVPGQHLMSGLLDLSAGGRVIGFRPSLDRVYTLASDSSPDVFLSVEGKVALSNINVDLTNSTKAGIMVTNKGNLSLNNVQIQDALCGIKVGAHCSIELTNCRVVNCTTGIHMERKTNVNLDSTSITNCDEGIVVKPSSYLNLKASEFRNNHKCDINSEVESAGPMSDNIKVVDCQYEPIVKRIVVEEDVFDSNTSSGSEFELRTRRTSSTPKINNSETDDSM